MDLKPPESFQKKRKKLTKEDVEAVCKLVARGMTESQAAAKLNIKQQAWFNYKLRNKGKFEETFTRLKAQRIDNLLQSVETALGIIGNPKKGWLRGLVGKQITEQAWQTVVANKGKPKDGGTPQPMIKKPSLREQVALLEARIKRLESVVLATSKPSLLLQLKNNQQCPHIRH